ncbi:MAG TPA: phenylalanine--tRNA ligase subunit beta [Armatimonadetes bacterium]|nr:phenylalanine--tRNA ligase subunit beta [Armatimonadota bacterium]
MLVPVEWLKEYTEFNVTIEELADRLTMAGLEVEEIEETPYGAVYSTYVTPNRPDLLSVFGVARDISALLGSKLKAPEACVTQGETDINSLAKIEIESPANCPRYSSRVITGVKVGESPAWMQERLIAAGMRPINNVVDASNYVLLELGQPLHTFDCDLLAEHKIIVRQARAGEKITTIDGEERQLDPATLVIADAVQPVAIAGIMGGFNSEVNWQTKNVLIESANFNRLSIRRSARRIGLATEASFRYERGVDPNLTLYALDRVVQLIQETGGGDIARGVIDLYPGKAEPRCIDIRPGRTSDLLGFKVTAKQIEGYLTALGMSVKHKAESLAVTVPTFRPDITREEDLIEEVGRIYGYEHIPETLLCGETLQGKDSPEGAFAAKLYEILISSGLQEVVTGTMTPAYEGGPQIPVRNPLNDEVCCLRSRLVPGMLNVIAHNAGRGVRDMAVFEIGHVVKPSSGGAFEEKFSVAAAITGTLWEETWNVDKASLAADFFLCKGITEHIFQRLGITNAEYKAEQLPGFHPTRAASIESDGKRLGVIGEVSDSLARQMDLPGRTYVFELDFEELMKRSGMRAGYAPLSRYPAVDRDLAVVISGDTAYSRVESLIREAAGELLSCLTLFDVYTGKPLQPGQKSLAFSIIFRSRERTLRDAEVDERMNAIRALLAAELGAAFRDT